MRCKSVLCNLGLRISLLYTLRSIPPVSWRIAQMPSQCPTPLCDTADVASDSELDALLQPEACMVMGIMFTTRACDDCGCLARLPRVGSGRASGPREGNSRSVGSQALPVKGSGTSLASQDSPRKRLQRYASLRSSADSH